MRPYNPSTFFVLWWGLVVLIQTEECTFDPTTFSVTSAQPVNPFTNCLEYCRQFYSDAPQRAYYNVSSHDCEPVRLCNHSDNHYNYATNLCYTDRNYAVENQSYIPSTLRMGTITLASKTVEMVCVNGDFTLLKIGDPAVCICKLLWETSGKVDMNGLPFYCDRATDHPDRHFYSSLQIDKNGQISKYGPFTAEQMGVIIINMKHFEQYQITQYTLNQTESIIYSVNQGTTQESLLKDVELVYLCLAGGGFLVILGASYWQHEKMRIKIKESQLKRKICQVLSPHDQ